MSSNIKQKWEKCMPVTFTIDDKIQHGHVYDQPTDDVVWCVYKDEVGYESIENFRPDELKPDVVYSKPSTINHNVIQVNFTSTFLRGRTK
jgi:hypothetical protein